jgi:hypothetical protein
MEDNDGHSYVVPVERRDYFAEALEQCELALDFDLFDDAFGKYRLDLPVSQYCFDNIRPIREENDTELA